MKGLVIIQVSCVLEKDDLADSEDLEDLSIGGIACYIYVRLVSCHVDRS